MPRKSGTRGRIWTSRKNNKTILALSGWIPKGGLTLMITLGLGFGFIVGGGSGCIHKESKEKGSPESGGGESSDQQQSGVHLQEVESFRASDPDLPPVVDEELEVIPTDINIRVEQWISYFQGRGREHMLRYLSRSTRYMKLMKKILRQNGLPEDLIYVALIESGFNHRATSRAAAVGYWQFIKGTGRRYGLEINAMLDERRDPVLSTQASAEYFKALYSVFGSWYLAMASYNVGENRIKKEVDRYRTRDFWDLARRGRLPAETVNYVPKFIAAKLIASQPSKYGFIDVDYEDPMEFELIRLQRPVNLRILANKMNLDYDDFKQLNPKFRGEVAPIKKDRVLELRVPLGKVQTALVAAQEAGVDRVEFVADAGETRTYRVRSGDSLYALARRFRTSVTMLREMNDFTPGRRLRVGMRIQVPDRSTKPSLKASSRPVMVAKIDTQKVNPEEDQATAQKSGEVVTKNGLYYIVQSGDTLTEIADEYDSSVRELRKLNHLARGGILKVGTRLRVPKPETPPAQLASPVVAANGDNGDNSGDGDEDSSNEEESDGVEVSSPSPETSGPSRPPVSGSGA